MNSHYSRAGSILERHLKEWEASAVNPDIIHRNVWSIEDSREVDSLLNRNSSTRWKHSDDMVPGWGVAGVDPRTGELSFKGAQYKPDTALADPKTQKARKYFSPSNMTISPLFLETGDSNFWPSLIEDNSRPLIITEGAKKAGSLLSKGYAAISLPGVTTGGKKGRLRPELEVFCRYGRRMYLAFDSDIVHKKAVQKALHNLARMLSDKGVSVYILEWSDLYKGIDDYIVNDGSVEKLIDSAVTIEEWKKIQEEEHNDLLEIETCRLALRYQQIEERLGSRMRWNSLKGEVELDGEGVDLDEIRIILALKHNIDIPVEDCFQIVSFMARQKKYHPVVEYLEDCSSTYSENSELLDSVASTYLGSDSPLHAAFIRKTLIAAVARAMNPGCKVDSVCILCGKQGAGKSSFWRILAGDWFDDSVGSVSDKDERLKLHQSWFVEWAELEAVFKRKDVSAVKAFITTQRDQIRPPYGRAVKDFPRPSVIVGTTNFDEFLADPTGNRRFWVVPVRTDWIPLDQLEEERDRIWAAAVHAYRSGESWTLPAELHQAAWDAGREFEMSDPWENVVLDFVSGRTQITVDEILTVALHIDIERQDKSAQMRVANILKANLWTTSREVVHGRRRRIWISPSFEDLGCPGCPEESETETAVGGQPPGQPPGQPYGQPSQETEVLQLDLGRDNLDNLDNLSLKVSGTTKIDLYQPLINLDDCNDSLQPIQAFIKGDWVPAVMVGPGNGMKYSPFSRQLEDSVRVQVGEERLTIAADCVRGVEYANG